MSLNAGHLVSGISKLRSFGSSRRCASNLTSFTRKITSSRSSKSNSSLKLTYSTSSKTAGRTIGSSSKISFVESEIQPVPYGFPLKTRKSLIGAASAKESRRSFHTSSKSQNNFANNTTEERLIAQAILRGDLSAAQKLHHDGVPLNGNYVGGNTLAHFAALSGRPETLMWLRDLGIDMRVKDQRGATILAGAVALGHEAVLRWALDVLGRELFLSDAAGGVDLVHQAVAAGQLSSLKVLALEVKMPLDTIGYQGTLTWHVAAQYGYVDILAFLRAQLGDDAAFEKVDPQGFNVLHHAAKKGRTEALKWLVEHLGQKQGVNNEHLGQDQGANHVTVEQQSAAKDDCTGAQLNEMVAKMMKSLVPPGFTLAEISLQSDNVETFKYIIAAGDTVWYLKHINPSGAGIIALMIALGKVAQLQCLVEVFGLSLSRTDADGKIVEIFAAEDGWSYAHWAAQSGRLPMLKWLQKNGFQLDKPNNEGHRPIYYAKESKADATVEWLLQNGAKPL